VICGTVLSGHVLQLDESRISATELMVEVGLSGGRHRDLVAEPKRSTQLCPFHENLPARPVRDLSLSGRRQAAVAAYRAVRSMLRGEPGIDHSHGLDNALRFALERAEENALPTARPAADKVC
jgi:SARP family transcriptional regulator, regulator of embCAB operon